MNTTFCIICDCAGIETKATTKRFIHGGVGTWVQTQKCQEYCLCDECAAEIDKEGLDTDCRKCA